MERAIWWIRRDLRLADNQALHAALESSEQVIPLFVLDPKLLASPYVGEKRLAFLLANLRELDTSLKKRGSRLFIRHGDATEVLAKIMEESKASMIFAEPDYSPYATTRDRRISKSFPIRWVGSPTVYPPGSVVKNDGSTYTIFTPFSRAWKSLPMLNALALIKAPENIRSPDFLESMPLPEVPRLSASIHFPPGEDEAHRRLLAFVNGQSPPIYNYETGRDRQDLDGTSKLSPYSRFGLISARQVALSAHAAIQTAPNAEARKSAESWMSELIWREFYVQILHHFPQVRIQNFKMKEMSWHNDPGDFAAWCEGRTGYPIVDAAMRQLIETGWMHNRSRMIVASFLTKDLLIDWKWGERWFMQHLIDGDPAANNGGWQWSAGTGTDAAPYFRIFNPVTQSTRHDPHGNYIRHWLPELVNVPGEFIHFPWKMSSELQRVIGCVIGRDYPNPIVDHQWARERALRTYGKVKKGEFN